MTTRLVREKLNAQSTFDWNDERYHELSRLFPPMAEPEFQEFKENIRQKKQQVEILTYQGKIVDGRCRDRALRELGIEPITKEWDGKGSLVDLVVSLNMHRRHLTESQRSMVAAKLQPMFEVEAEKRMLAGKAADPVANLPQGKSRDKAAQVMKVSPRSVGSAKKVLTKGVPELVEAVELDKVKVSKAAKIAKLPQAEQKTALAKGKPSINDVLSRINKAKQEPKDKSHSTLVLSLDMADMKVAESLVTFCGIKRAIAIRDALNKQLDGKASASPAGVSVTRKQRQQASGGQKGK